MTKMQIIAKAGLVSLGIYAIVTLCWHLSCLTPLFDFPSLLTSILFYAAFAVFIAVIVFFLIFNNNDLARKIVGPEEELNPTAKALWLTASLRLAVVFCGLILLSTSIPTILSILLSPIHIRTWVNELFLFRGFPKSLMFPFRKWCTLIYDFLKTILAIYLLCGAPHFVRWQLRHSIAYHQPNTPKIETASSSTSNSERTKNE